jgi:biotin carboxyl carrier protein
MNMEATVHKIQVKVNGESFLVEVGDLERRPIIAYVEGSRFEIYPEAAAMEGDAGELPQDSPMIHSIPGKTICEVIAPMPGDITVIQVKTGQSIQPGDPLCVLDAMKMKNTIHAPQAGVIQEVLVKEGQAVEYGLVLFRLG